MTVYESPSYVERDPAVVKDMTNRAGRILLALLDEMRQEHPVAQRVYDGVYGFVQAVLDGTHPVPTRARAMHIYYDDWGTMEKYPLLSSALSVFNLSLGSVQRINSLKYLEELEEKFTRREVGAGRVKGGGS